MNDAEQERAAIVAWLRERLSGGAKMPMAIANAIERGDHRGKQDG